MIKRIFVSYSFVSRENYRQFHQELVKYFATKNIEVFSFVFDYTKAGDDKTVMKDALLEIDKSDLLLAEAETMALGVGLEAGYAHGKGIKVGYLYKTGSQKQQTISGIADYIIEYQTAEDVIAWFNKNYFPIS